MRFESFQLGATLKQSSINTQKECYLESFSISPNYNVYTESFLFKSCSTKAYRLSQNPFMNYERLFLGTKGLNIKEVSKDKYVIEDVFGICSSPYIAQNPVDLITSSYKIARTIPLISRDSSIFFETELDSNYWFELEKYYIDRLCDCYRVWQCGQSNYIKYDSLTNCIPIGYVDSGYGAGSREVLERIHQATLESIKNGKSGFTEKFLSLRLMHLQFIRICDDLLSILQRAIYAFKELLFYQRQAIKTHSGAIYHLETNEIIHTGPISYNIASSATLAVISLCTSLDLSSQMIHFVNASKTPIDKFSPSQGKHFSELKNIRGNVLFAHELNTINDIWNGFTSIESLIQFRHSLIHRTSALELEKLYVGRATKEICNLPMHYSFQPWRDCEANGQPLRYLGREYFVSNGVDFERQLCKWLINVIQGHLAVGENVLDLIIDRTKKANFDLDL